jgi:hypothetical protein
MYIKILQLFFVIIIISAKKEQLASIIRVIAFGIVLEERDLEAALQ